MPPSACDVSDLRQLPATRSSSRRASRRVSGRTSIAGAGRSSRPRTARRVRCGRRPDGERYAPRPTIPSYRRIIATALKANSEGLADFQALAPTHRRHFVVWIHTAKQTGNARAGEFASRSRSSPPEGSSWSQSRTATTGHTTCASLSSQLDRSRRAGTDPEAFARTRDPGSGAERGAARACHRERVRRGRSRSARLVRESLVDDRFVYTRARARPRQEELILSVLKMSIVGKTLASGPCSSRKLLSASARGGSALRQRREAGDHVFASVHIRLGEARWPMADVGTADADTRGARGDRQSTRGAEVVGPRERHADRRWRRNNSSQWLTIRRAGGRARRAGSWRVPRELVDRVGPENIIINPDWPRDRIEWSQYEAYLKGWFGVDRVTVIHTRDRRRSTPCVRRTAQVRYRRLSGGKLGSLRRCLPRHPR